MQKFNFQTQKNVFTLFSNLIGYPEVDSLRQHCLTAVHRSWLQLVSSWLLYGHVSVASSAFENNFDEAEQHKLVEELLVNKDKPQTSTANYLDGDTTNNDDNVMNGDISQSLFLPPGVTPEMGYLIYTTGNVVRLFVGFSSHGANGTSASLGVDSANLFKTFTQLHSLHKYITHFLGHLLLHPQSLEFQSRHHPFRIFRHMLL